MAEYIEREALQEILKRYSVGTWRGVPCYPDEIKSAAKDVNALPAADVVEVKHGEWVDKWGGRYANQLYKCSVCGEIALGNDKTWFLTDYCPNCGARMDGE